MVLCVVGVGVRFDAQQLSTDARVTRFNSMVNWYLQLKHLESRVGSGWDLIESIQTFGWAKAACVGVVDEQIRSKPKRQGPLNVKLTYTVALKTFISEVFRISISCGGTN